MKVKAAHIIHYAGVCIPIIQVPAPAPLAPWKVFGRLAPRAPGLLGQPYLQRPMSDGQQGRTTHRVTARGVDYAVLEH